MSKYTRRKLVHRQLHLTGAGLTRAPTKFETGVSIDSPCECEHNNPVVSVGVCYTAVDAAAGGLTTGWWAIVLECFSSHLLWSMVTASATANTTVKNSRASRESGLLCSHSQTVYSTKGTRAHTHRELIRKWLWEPKGSSLEYI